MGVIMKVWIEAYQQILIGKYKKAELDKLSDDDIADLFFQYIKEKGIEKEALKWVQEYCRQWK